MRYAWSYWARGVQYAEQLKEAGPVADGIAYSEAAIQLMTKAKVDRSASLPFDADTMLASAMDLRERLNAHAAATGASLTPSGASFVSRVGCFIDKKIMSLMGADEIIPGPAPTTSTPQVSHTPSVASLTPTQSAPLLQMQSMSGASTPLALCGASSAPYSANFNIFGVHTPSQGSVPAGFAAPQGAPLGAWSAACSAATRGGWSSGPAPNAYSAYSGASDPQVALENGHTGQVCEADVAVDQVQGSQERPLATETKASASKWLSGFAARMLPATVSKEIVSWLSGSNSDSQPAPSEELPDVGASEEFSHGALAPSASMLRAGVHGTGEERNDPYAPPAAAPPQWSPYAPSGSQWSAAPAASCEQAWAPPAASVSPAAPNAGAYREHLIVRLE